MKDTNRVDNLRWLSRADNIRVYQEQKKGQETASDD